MNQRIENNDKACFTREQIKDYCLGRTNEMTAIKMEQHIDGCENCEDTFASLESAEDTFVRDLKSVSDMLGNLPDDQIHNDESIKNSLDHAKGLVGDSADPHSRNGVSTVSQPQNMIGDYVLCELIGRGGMGQVFRAKHRRLEKEFALKILGSRRWRSSEAVSRFQREMKIIGHLDHSAIVQATDAGQTADVHYLTMEFVSGMNLARIIHFADPIESADACELIRQAAEGIEYAHQKSVIHRDLKPSNLMLNEQGCVKILDLGLATLSSLNHSVDELTTVGQMMGTLDYMAPEQCEDQQVDHRCDVYSLGATLYKLLSGRAPYSAESRVSPLQKLRAIAIDSFTPLTEHRTDLPTELVDIVHRCLDRDPNARFQSAAELAKSLEPFCEQHDLVKLLERAVEQKEQSDLETETDLHTQKSSGHDLESWNAAATPASSAKSAGSRRGWIVALIAVALLPLMYFGIEIIINWDKGQLVIESESANVSVRLVKDGKPYKELNIQQGTNSTRVRAGKYEILIDDPSDQLVVDNDQFILKRGDTTVATITSKPKKAGKKDSLLDKTASSDEPTYRGKSISEWLEDVSDAETIKAANAFRRNTDAEVRKRAIRKLIQSKQKEVSIDDLYQVLRVAGQLCPDDEMANELLDFWFDICKRYDANEILNLDVSLVYRYSDGRTSRRSIWDISRALPFHADVFERRMLDCVFKDDLSLTALGAGWINDSRSDLPKTAQVLSRLIELCESEDDSIRKYAFSTLNHRFADQPKTHDYYMSQLDSDDLDRKLSMYATLCSHAPKTAGLAKRIVADLKKTDGPYFSVLVANVDELALAGNQEIVGEIERILANAKWGWEPVANQSDPSGISPFVRSSRSMRERVGGGRSSYFSNIQLLTADEAKQTKNWFGVHGSERFADDAVEKSATQSAKRSVLIADLGERLSKGKGNNWLPLLKKELDVRYNNHYLEIVLSAIAQIDHLKINVFESFWCNLWVTTDDEQTRNRAYQLLQSRSTGRGSSLSSTISHELFLAMRNVNCIEPNPNERKLIDAACDLYSDGISRGRSTSGLYRLVLSAKSEDIPFVLWFVRHLNSIPNARSYSLQQEESRFLILETIKLKNPVLTMRALELTGNQWGYSYVQMLDDYELTAQQRLAVLRRMGHGRRRRGIGKSELHLETLKSGTANEIVPILADIRISNSNTPRKAEPSVTDVSQTSWGNGWLLELLVDPRKEIMSKAASYEADLWSQPMLKKLDDDFENVHRVLELLKYERFVESDFNGKKKEIIATLKKVVQSTSDEDRKSVAQRVLDKVELSESVAAYLRAFAISEASRVFKRQAGVFPDDIKDLLVLPKGMDNQTWRGPQLRKLVSQQDPWGTDFRFDKSEIKNTIVIVSAGPDKKFDTDDDVASDSKRFRSLAR